MRLRNFEDHLDERLRDPDYVATYINAALGDGGIAQFLYAVREVVMAQEGAIQRVSAQSKHRRESLYKSLLKQGNPRIRTLDSILHAMGMRIAVTRDETTTRNQAREVLALA